MENRLKDVRTWYGGYSIAGNDMFCPWSVINFLSEAHQPGNSLSTFKPENCRENYGTYSGDSDIIELLMRHPDSLDSMKLQNLTDGKTEEIDPDEFTRYPVISTKTCFDTIASLMLNKGYFTVDRDVNPSDSYHAVIKIPNEEIRRCFKEEAEYLFSSKNPEWLEKAYSLKVALFKGEPKDVQSIIRDMLMIFICFRDPLHENCYHGFMTGVFP